jgi:hypothetical protein
MPVAFTDSTLQGHTVLYFNTFFSVLVFFNLALHQETPFSEAARSQHSVRLALPHPV